MWNVIICDDDPILLNAIKKQVKECSSDLVESIQCFSTIDNLLFYLEDHSKEFYIIYMDIEFRGKAKGISAGKRITELQPYSSIVFMSAYKNYFEDVYDVEHSFFLLKPFSNEKLRRSLIRAGERISYDFNSSYNIMNKDVLCRVDKQSIWMLENNKRKVYFHTDYGVEWSSKKIETIVDELNDGFVQCHKSYAVNLRKVLTMETTLFRLKNGLEVPISRNYYKATKDKFLKFLMEN